MQVLSVSEPTVVATIIAPGQYCGQIMQLASNRRGQQLEMGYLAPAAAADGARCSNNTSISNGNKQDVQHSTQDAPDSNGNGSSSSSSVAGDSSSDRVVLRYQLPLSELAGDFYSKLKSVTRG